MKLTGKCHCGNLTYEIDDEAVVRLPDCTCRDCQRATGALTVPYVSVNPSSMKITRGKGKIFKAAGGTACDQNGKWMYCGTCGSRIMWMEDMDKFYTVLAGTVNELEPVAALPVHNPSNG